MRHFTHLSQITIREIIAAHQNGEPKLAIARRFSIDHSTVHYHLKKHERSVYSLIPPKPECLHLSLKCLVCGKAHDNIKRDERLTIKLLTEKLAAANLRLERAGLSVE